MKRKKDDQMAHELRDKPVPPVKGAVTLPRPEDTVLCPRPTGGTRTTPSADDAEIMDGWL